MLNVVLVVQTVVSPLLGGRPHQAVYSHVAPTGVFWGVACAYWGRDNRKKILSKMKPLVWLVGGGASVRDYFPVSFMKPWASGATAGNSPCSPQVRNSPRPRCSVLSWKSTWSSVAPLGVLREVAQAGRCGDQTAPFGCCFQTAPQRASALDGPGVLTCEKCPCRS